MAGKITQTTQLNFQTKGAAKTVKQIGTVTKAETRLGQTAASAGRQFSAQANGLGGLVSAYAGAAANIFAITQAFSALSRAAQAEQTIQGTRSLAAEFGLAGDEIIAKVQEITRGQLSIAEAAQNVNIALSAGFNTDQIDRLTSAALKTSIALGRNLTDAQQRLLRGTAKIEPELLDELGIFVRLDTAVQQYADKTGKAANTLTQFERSQAFLNATLEQAESKFSAIDPSIEGSVASFERLGAKIADLGQKFGALLAITLVPFADFISGNFLNTLSAFGILAGIVFAKLGTVVRDGIGSATSSIERFGDSLSQKFARNTDKADKAATKLTSTLAKLDLRTIKGTRNQQTQTKELIRLAQAGTLTTSELQKLNVALARQDKLNPRIKASLKLVSIQLNSVGIAARAAAGAFGFLAKSARFLGAALNGILRFAGIFGLVISGLQLISSAIAKVFGVDFLKEAAEAVENFFTDLGKGFAAEKAAVSGATRVMQTNTTAVNENEAALRKNIAARKALADSAADREQMDKDSKSAKERAEQQATAIAATFRAGTSDRASTFAKGVLRDLVGAINQASGEEFTVAKLKDMPDNFLKVAIEALSGEKIKKLVGEEAAKTIIDGTVLAFKGAGDAKTRREVTDFLRKVIEGSRLDAAAALTKTDGGFMIGNFFEMKPEQIIKLAEPLINFTLNLEKLTKGFESGAMKGKDMQNMFAGLERSFNQLTDNLPNEKLGKLGDALRESRRITTFKVGIDQLEKTFKKLNGSLIKSGQSLEKFFSVQEGTPTLLFRERDIRLNNLQLIEKTLEAIKGEKTANDLNKMQLDAIAGLYAKIGPAVEKLEKSLKKQEQTLANQLAILQKQNEVQSAQRTLQLAQKQNKLIEERFNLQQQFNGNADKFAKSSFDLEQKKNKLSKERLSLERRANEIAIRTLDRQTQAFARQRNLQRDQKIAGMNKQQTVMGALPGFFSEGQGRKLEIAISQENVNALQDIFNKEAAALEEFTKKQDELVRKQLEGIDKEVAAITANIAFQQRALVFQNADLANQKQRAEERKAELDQERRLQKEVIVKQEALAIKQAEIAKEQAFAQLDIQKQNVDLLKAESEMLQRHIEALGNVLLGHAQSLDKVMNRGNLQLTSADTGSLKAGNINAEVFTVLDDLSKRLGGRGDEMSGPTGLFAAQAGIASAQKERAFEIRKGAEEQLKLDMQIKKEKLDALIEEKNQLIEINKLKIKSLEEDRKLALLKGNKDKAAALDERAIELENRQIALAGKKAELQTASNALINKSIDDRLKSDKMLQFAQKATTKVGDRLGNSLQELFKSMREGTLTTDNFKQGLQDMFVGILEDIQSTLLEETVINPMKDFLKESLGSLFGFDTGAGDKLSTYSQGNALRVTMAGGGIGPGTSGAAFNKLGSDTKIAGNEVADIMAANADFPGMTGITGEMDDFNAAGVSTFDEFDMSMTDFGKTGVDSISTMGSSFSDFADSATNALFSMNGLAMTIGGVIGGAIGGPAGAVVGAVAGPLVKAGIGALIGSFGGPSLASGGIVRHMAAGGMQRDRVPAMLEPGEFVMKRSAVKNVGADSLAAMNAGSSSGTPNIEVVVNNEGSAKDASASVRPQVDINKMVVEIVTRDIRNNGPIRKTLRTGAE